jgi:glycosyltransferase involved in cell wall biosynthesis
MKMERLDATADGRARREGRIAFVVQRCGIEVNGGAEALCLKIAQRMTRHWNVEVLTTCALEYVTWANHYPPGTERVGDVPIHRFPVGEPRDIEHFNALCGSLAGKSDASLAEQEAWMRAQGPWSPALLEFIESNAGNYDAFIFFGYLYAQTYYGLPKVRSKAVLVPLAHDEWTIHLPMWNRFFELPSGFVFNTDAELAFLRSRFPHVAFNGPVLGVGVERPSDIDPIRFRKAFGLTEPYLLYVGRIDPSKGCDALFQYFIRHVEETRDSRQLVLLGHPVMPIPGHPQIVSLGFVTEQTKWDALAGCELLLMPSPYESLSMVLLEAWSVGKPVLVNGECAVLKEQCKRANGGIWYRNYSEFSAALAILGRGIRAHALGRQGHAFVNRSYIWRNIENGYLALVRAITQ